MTSSELAKLLRTLAREEAVHTYARAHDRHIESKLIAMHSGDVAAALLHDEAGAIAMRAYRAEAFNPLPEGLP